MNSFKRTSASKKSISEAFLHLVQIMDELREKCPWDQKQSFESLRPLTIEETYELAEAILESDYEGISEEIGDILLHMIFYAKIGEEKNLFTLTDALNNIAKKLIHRHPHVYGDLKVKDENEVKQNWEKLKMKEGKTSILQGVPMSLPAMIKALRLQEKTAQVGFEWSSAHDVWKKVEEEILELQEAIDQERPQVDIEEEFGDILFSLVNYARYLHVDPELALARTNAKFKRRFEYIERHTQGALEDMTLAEMDTLWDQAKNDL